MRRKLLGLGLASILALGGLAACGGTTGGTGGERAGDDQPATGPRDAGESGDSNLNTDRDTDADATAGTEETP